MKKHFPDEMTVIKDEILEDLHNLLAARVKELFKVHDKANGVEGTM